MNIGYVRSKNMNFSQIEKLKEYGLDIVFTDNGSGNDIDRPVLREMIETAQKGDTIYICDLNRLSRNMHHLIEIMKELQEKGVNLITASSGEKVIYYRINKSGVEL